MALYPNRLEDADLKSVSCGFESHQGYQFNNKMKIPEHIEEFKEEHSEYWEFLSDQLETIFNGSNKDLINYVRGAKELLESEMNGGRNIYTVALEEVMHRLQHLTKLTESENDRRHRGFW
jgi:hypothetical protein